VATPNRTPIRSLLVDDESLERLDAFLMALGERIDGIQEAEFAGALDELGKSALALASDAAALGLPPLAEAARRVAESSQRGDPRRLHDEVLALTEVATCVRLGHRTSACL
jgi:hypothetical protein